MNITGTAKAPLAVTNTAPYPVRYIITAILSATIGPNARAEVETWLTVDDAAGGAFTTAQGTFSMEWYSSGPYTERHTQRITYVSDPVAPGATLRATPVTSVGASSPGSGWGVEAGYSVRAVSTLF